MTTNNAIQAILKRSKPRKRLDPTRTPEAYRESVRRHEVRVGKYCVTFIDGLWRM